MARLRDGSWPFDVSDDLVGTPPKGSGDRFLCPCVCMFSRLDGKKTSFPWLFDK